MKHLRSIILVAGLLLIDLPTQVSLAQLDTRSPSSFSTLIDSVAQPLPLEQAFPFYVSETAAGQLRINWDIAADHYLYRHAFEFSMQQSADDDIIAVEYSLPAGLRRTDQFFGEIEVYYDRVSVELTLTEAPAADAMLVIQYRGCADWGFCYPPQRSEFNLNP